MRSPGRSSQGIDGYVNDAFGASHRAHASIVGPPKYVPSAAGRLLQREVEVLLGMRNKPARPFVAVLGGAKVSDKLGVIDALLETVDALAIGGAMCFTFLAAQGNPIGDSLFEPDQVETCRRLLADDDEADPPAERHRRPRRRRQRADVRHAACPTAPRASTSGPARRPSSATS